MIELTKVPTLEEARRMMKEAEERNPGPWAQHSIFVGQAAALIAAHHPELDPSTAFLLGYLHDIGRREGVTDLRHVLDGYLYLSRQGYDDAAQICMTHSFPEKNTQIGSGEWDCSPEEFDFVVDYLSKVVYTEYDRLIQLCDCLALPTGFCLIEKRCVDVALRRGVNEYTIKKWKAFLKIQKEFEQVIGQSVYLLLPGIIENTFGIELSELQP